MRKLIFGSLIVFAGACSSGNKPDEQAFLEALDSTAVEGPAISEEVISSVLQQIPSPLEISVLLKESGTKYNKALLNSPDNLSKYNSNYRKALNLGIYGTDLGYTNIYEQNQDGLDYMGSIKELADGLNIGQFFDIETIGRLATNSANLDSLLLITTQNFNNINHYLQEQSRANLSVLLLTGGWLEAMHITCQVSALSPGNKELQETIGSQKIILENIVLLLSFYQEVDQNMASLLSDIQELQKEYESIEIVTTYKESTFEVIDGVMVIKDNSTSEVKITDENINNIKNLIGSIRNKIIS
ncbi:hypothetical protein FNH22_15255 [Fulvivirga sp. M361]|uniref:hypothetical protein n=1 Tax=Fulvivirga sp. M361 TaxID=2594266 RepID=UPI00117B6CD4|nr:hypothetical protein [Fulvivirga sp. M361]TRX57763.1 hypothetical protein FNH22_15255 [Fulvivirga sp. M361]